MSWTAPTLWWLVAGALVAAELATGTFYLLMLALGAAAAAMASHLGLGLTAQLVIGAIVGGGAVAAWHLRRQGPAAPADASTNRDINLDIGSTVHVPEWRADGTARVSYRGAPWDVKWAGSGPAAPGDHLIHAVEGNRLMLVRAST